MKQENSKYDWTEQEMEEMWAESEREAIASDIQVIATIQNDEQGEGVEELIETFSSHVSTFFLLKEKENTEALNSIEKEIYLSLVNDILLPILEKMEQWGNAQWVIDNQISYKK